METQSKEVANKKALGKQLDSCVKAVIMQKHIHAKGDTHMIRTLALIAASFALAVSPALARGHGSSHHSSGSHSGMHEHFAKEVHQMRGGHMITIRPRHAKALHFYSKKY